MRGSLLSCLMWHIIFFTVIASSTPLAFANEATVTPAQKKWELGLGVGAVAGPDYRGSDEYRSYVSPIPYFIYRGKYLHSDRDGVRGNFFRSDKYEFTLSASASITPETDKNELREGMPELGSTFELGPSLNINLTGQDFSSGWHLQIPWRAVFAIGAEESGYLGSVIQPQLVYRTRLAEWTFNYRAGFTYASNDYHDYYYRVTPEQATAQRSAYEASAGYSGWNNNFSFTRNYLLHGFKTRLALFVRYDNIDHTDITQSPLVVENHSLRGGIALIWVIK